MEFGSILFLADVYGNRVIDISVTDGPACSVMASVAPKAIVIWHVVPF